MYCAVKRGESLEWGGKGRGGERDAGLGISGVGLWIRYVVLGAVCVVDDFTPRVSSIV